MFILINKTKSDLGVRIAHGNMKIMYGLIPDISCFTDSLNYALHYLMIGQSVKRQNDT